MSLMHGTRCSSAIYPPLHGDLSIRLMQLEPGIDEDPIHVQLSSVPSLHSTNYDALSYVWGDHADTRAIICNGHQLSITVNLFWALHRVRDSVTPKCIWADAICINQVDKEELSHQVAMMGQIYSGADIVYICMAGCPEGDDVVVQALVARALPYTRGEVSWSAHAGYDITTDVGWHAMTRLDLNPWFKRAWVIQEAGLARAPHVLYGNVEFRYRDLISILEWRSQYAWSFNFGSENWAVHRVWVDWSQPPEDPDMTFLDLLSHSCYLECSDPRDHIYAFLGHPLAQDALIKPDYTKDVVDLYLEVTQVLLQEFGLRVLSMVEHNARTIEEHAPSWTLRWDAFEILNDIDGTHHDFNASADIGASLNCDGRCLVIRGTILDTVEEVLDIDVQHSSLSFRQGGTTMGLQGLAEYFAVRFAAGALDMLGRTLVADQAMIVDMTRALTSIAYSIPPASDHERDGLVSYCELAASIVKGRCLAITEHGHLALAPKITRPGDQACVLFGGKVPLMIRPTSHGHRLLGETYLHGFMHGEMAPLLAAGELSEECIVLH